MHKIRNERGNTSTDTAEIQNIIRDSSKQSCQQIVQPRRNA